MQIDIPHSTYGRCDYSVPKPIAEWLNDKELEYSYCGVSSHGSFEGVYYHFVVPAAEREDVLAFKINFPTCRVHYLTLD